MPDIVLGALHTFDFIQSSFQPYEVGIIVVTDSVEKIAKTQLAKEQNRDSDLGGLSLYQIHLVFLHPSTSHLYLPLFVQCSGDVVHVVSFLLCP